MRETCKAEGCHRAVKYRGLCNDHLTLEKHGYWSLDGDTEHVSPDDDVVETEAPALVLDPEAAGTTLHTGDVEVDIEPEPVDDRVVKARGRVAHPEVILWLAQRHADEPSTETLEMLRQAVGA